MPTKTILATSGGFSSTGRGSFQTRFAGLMNMALALSGAQSPTVCLLPTATGDAEITMRAFYGAASAAGVKASHLQLFSMPNVDDVAGHLLAHDVIWAGGGSVANLLAVWRVHGLDEILRTAWERGVVLAGVSAGSICWHVGGPTDSFGPDLEIIGNGLGFLPFSNGVHYDSEAQRRPTYQRAVADGLLPEGYATEDGVGVLYSGTKFAGAFSEIDGKRAFHVTRGSDGAAVETELDVRPTTAWR